MYQTFIGTVWISNHLLPSITLFSLTKNKAGKNFVQILNENLGQDTPGE